MAAFMEAVLAAWVLRAPESAPSDRDLDKFLMMYGKAIKKRPTKQMHTTAATGEPHSIKLPPNGTLR